MFSELSPLLESPLDDPSSHHPAACTFPAHNPYLTGASTDGFFPWKDLEPHLQERILQLAPAHLRRYFTNPDGGFNWAELDPGLRAQIRNLVRDQWRPVDLRVPTSVPWPVPYRPMRIAV